MPKGRTLLELDFHFHLNRSCAWCGSRIAIEFIDSEVMRCTCGALRHDWTAMRGDYRCSKIGCLNFNLYLVHHSHLHQVSIQWPATDPEPLGWCETCRVAVPVEYIHPGWLKPECPVKLQGVMQ